MRKPGLKWYGIGIPLAGLVALLFRPDSGGDSLYILYLAACAASLGVVQAFPRAAARQISTRKVMGSLILSLILALIPTAGVLAISRNKISVDSVIFAILPWMLVAIPLIEELFASQGDHFSAQLTDALAAIGICAALLIPSETFTYVAIAAAIPLLVGGSIAIGFSRRGFPQLSLTIFKEIPVGLLRVALYPALVLAMYDASGAMEFSYSAVTMACILAGAILIELGRSTFKRDRSEGAAFAAAMGGIAVLFAAAATLDILPTSMLTLAVACGILLYGSWGTAFFAGLILLAGAFAGILLSAAWLLPVSAILANALMLNQWREVFRQIKVKRLQRRMMKLRGQKKTPL